MKKTHFNKLAVLIIAVFILPLCLMLTACNDNKNNMSAYEIAVENGFTGTEQEWLDSLKGKSAYDIAIENGFVGTEQEWLDSLQGQNGKDGKDSIVDTYAIYQAAKENGEFEDENYTYLDFLKDYFSKSDKYTSANLTKNLYSIVSVFAYRTNITSGNHSAAGSGIIYSLTNDGDAYIVTNYHVAYNQSTKSMYPVYKIYLYGQDDVPIIANYFGGSRTYDIAILKVEKSEVLARSNAQAVTINLDGVSLGEACYSIGNTSEYGLSVTKGIISVESEEISMTVGGVSGKHREIRHDSYIYHGNSGGGLFNANGELIGLTNGGRENTLMNYAIPTNIVKAVTDNIIKSANDDNKKAKIYTTGLENNLIASQTLSVYDSGTSKIVIQETILISNISEGSLLSNSDLQAGDELISLTYNGTTYETISKYNLRSFTLQELLLSSKSGDVLEFTAQRLNTDGSIQTITAKIVLTESHTAIIF